MRSLLRLLLLPAAGAGLLAQSPFTVSPTFIDFGNQPVGASSAAQPFTVTYSVFSETAPPPPLSFTVTPSPSVFSVDAGSFTLSNGSSRTVNARFTPTALGSVVGGITVTASSGTQVVGSFTLEVGGFGIPGFSVSPSPLSLGNVLLGCANTRSLLVTGPILLDYSVQSTNPVFAVDPVSFQAQSRTVGVTFTPGAAGPTNSILSITGRSGSLSANQTLVADGVGVDIVASPAVLDFGAVPVGSTPAPRTVTFATSPSAPIALNPSASSSGPYRITINGNQATITFTPAAEGDFNQNLVFTFARQEQGYTPCTVTRTVAVRGSGVRLNVTPNPSSIDFGQVTRGTASPPRTTTVTNGTSFAFTGTATLNNTAFTVTPATFTLPAQGSAVFNLTFRPAADGPASGVLTLQLTGSGQNAQFQTTVTVNLTGTGINPAVLSVAPGTLDFGDVSVGSSQLRVVTVTNTGGQPASVTASTNNAAFAAAPASFNLAAGASQTVNLTFTPSAAGPVQAAATFAITGSSQTVSLTGRGVAPSLGYQVTVGQSPAPVSPGGSVSFPATNVGATSAFVEFEVRNTGTGAATLTSIASSTAVFMLDSLPSLPAVVPPGGSLTFRIAFRPSNAGPNTGTLTVGAQTFNLTGTGLLSGVTFTGSGPNLSPATQPTVGLTIPSSLSGPLSGQLILSFAANAAGAPDEPAIQFASGGRTVSFTIPAGSTAAQFGNASEISFQSGTVAGTITIRAVLQAGGVDVTPSPAPVRTFTVARAAPSIRSVTIANRTAAGFQAVIVAFSVTREVNTLTFTFTASGTGALQTTSLQVDVGTLLANWFRSADSAPFGGAFTLTVPFTVTGDLAAVRSLSVTMNNGDGASAAATANF